MPHGVGHPARVDREHPMEINEMSTKWTFSSAFLPYAGELIDFQFEDREDPIHGKFSNGIFHSRWADYETDRVQSLRSTTADPGREAIIVESQNAKGRAWLARLSGVARRPLIGGDQTAPAPEALISPGNIVRPIFGATNNFGMKERHDTNQLSS